MESALVINRLLYDTVRLLWFIVCSDGSVALPRSRNLCRSVLGLLLDDIQYRMTGDNG